MKQGACQSGARAIKGGLSRRNAIAASENLRWVWFVGSVVLRAHNILVVAAAVVLSLAAPLNMFSAHAQPSASDAMSAYRTVQEWIHTWSVPDQAQPIDPPGAAGACVTLRLSGRVMGRGVSMTDNGTSLWEAARRAWHEAASTMPVERDALRQENLRALAPQLMIDVQIAGDMTPLLANSLTEAALSVSPGRQGVAARVNERIEAIFPGHMLSLNMTPGDGFIAALGALGLAPNELSSLKKETGLILYRFDVQHIAQPAPGEPPLFLTRGGRVVATRDITPASLRRFGDQLAANLLQRQWPGEEPFGLLGTYKPWLGEYENGPAAPLEQALAALALARWAEVSTDRAEVRAAALAGAKSILQQLDAHHEGEPKPEPDVAANSMQALANMRIAGLSNERPPASRATAPAAVSSATGGPISANGPEPAPIARSIRAFATAQGARTHGVDELAHAARRDVRELFQKTPPAQLPALMPWLGWAELMLLEPGERVPSAIALREFRDLVERHQISAVDVAGEGDDDFVGGVVFTKGDAALPTWHSIRPMIFLATMVGDTRLTSPDERAAHFVRLLDGVRFARELAVDEANCHMFPNPDRALGGVRVALWDQRQPIEATALTLLFVAETLDAARKIASEPEDRP